MEPECFHPEYWADAGPARARRRTVVRASADSASRAADRTRDIRMGSLLPPVNGADGRGLGSPDQLLFLRLAGPAANRQLVLAILAALLFAPRPGTESRQGL